MICSFVLPFKNADFTFESTVLIFSLTLKSSPNDFVSFSISSTTGTIYASSLFLKQDCDWQAALDYLNNKYYYYELGSTPDENRFAFTNKPDLSDSTIGITFDGANGSITYVDLKASRSEAGKKTKNEFPIIKVKKPNL